MSGRRLEIRTRLARAGADRIYFRGYELTTDLIDDSIWSVLSVAFGHRRLSNEEAEVINALVIVAAVGDPRIWPLKVARLVSSYGRPFAAIAAGGSFLDGIPLGPWAMRLAAEFLIEASGPQNAVANVVDEARALAASRRMVPGFGVAGRERDERYVDFARWYASRPSMWGSYWRMFQELATEIEPLGLFPNIAGGFAAVGLDLGLNPLQIAMFTGASAHWATAANAVAGLEESPEVIRNIDAAFVRYEGPQPRQSPRARRPDPGPSES